MKTAIRAIVVLPLLWTVVAAHVQRPATAPAPSPVLKALEEEAARAFESLKSQGEQAPYFISYEATDIDVVTIQGSLGALATSDRSRSRLLDIDIRVGDYALDNTHQIRGQRGGSASGFTFPTQMPLDDDIDALKSVIWLETDRRYKAAVERFIQVKANRAVRVEEEDSSADLSRENKLRAVTPSRAFPVDSTAWERRIKEYSALFGRFPGLQEGNVSFTANTTRNYLANTEGTAVEHGATRFRINIEARTKAEDGMDLYRFESFDAHTPDRLPSDAIIRQSIEALARDVLALRDAPIIEPFTGPAILSGRASGVFFHEIFGHRIEGHRQKNESEGQTFTRQINQPVLPPFISVHDDPTAERAAGIDLNGHYAYDNDGVAAQRVPVVEQGVLRNFLLSRSPVAGFERSNGHGRKAPGYRTVGRQGNLMIQSSTTVTDARLRAMLVEEARKQGKEFGLFFKDISGGFTLTGRGSTQSFQVTPIMVYRVFVDGRPDELVRGVDLIGTPLTSFSKIVAAGDRPEVFNGYCGAESGFVPVSAVSPSILTTQIEVQKRSKSSERPPILTAPPRPGGPGGSR